ncbi:MAG: 50S ribosomal protein L18 [Ignavibacteria bacterium]|nr:50S ribosomal protein L18 [Ignavibacteria bacterium]
MKALKLKKIRRQRRKNHIRKSISGTNERLRMTIYRSLNHIYVQLIDDDLGETLLSASTLDKEVVAEIKPEMKKTDKSKLVGSLIAKRAKEKNITNVVFDRNGYLYHGRVKALADAARKDGLQF